MRAVAPPSVRPWRPTVPKMAPIIPLTIPLRMSPAPSAASQPSTTLTQLVPRSSSGAAYPELRAERTSRSSTLWAFVLPSLSVIRALLSVVLSVRSLACPLRRALGLGHRAIVEQCSQDPTDDGPEDVEPHAREVPRDQHGPEGARRVDGASGDGARDEHA